jgi:hypothetical protein
MDVSHSLSSPHLRRRRGHTKADIAAATNEQDVAPARDESEAPDAAEHKQDEHAFYDALPSFDATHTLDVKTSHVVITTIVTVLIAIFAAWTVRVAHNVFVMTVFKLVEVVNYDITNATLVRAASYAIDGLKSLPKLYKP